MAKRFNKDDAVYFPVKIAEVEYEDRWYDYVVRGIIGADGTKDGFPFCVKDEEVKTAEEVADGLDLIARATLEEYTEKADRKIRSLEQQLADAKELLSEAQAKVDELTKADCMRVQEFKPIIEERDRLKTELDQEKKRTQVWKDASEDHRKRAEELEGDVRRYEQDISEAEVTVQKLTKENDSLKADILELRAQINVFRPDTKEIEALKKRINMLEKLKEVHIKAIRRSTKQLKEKDFMISALVKKGIELEEGGEQ